MTDLDALEALEKAATEPPWHEFMFSRFSREDALLIEAIRNALPALIRELRAARELVKAAKESDGWISPPPCWIIDALTAYDAAVKGET